ncbi:uncharacterized protein Tco025E_00026 [Trypanosoma conorhini]|uniref:Transmembrane protein n=1 Tax=Trypanosoma conorhini TaxID=83891 RepID=A0A422QCC8_9TRYP|nr:uncharacterized protein Tco025E_00026 [Trypanosoma conorhini]RNF27642.1 hypothetical protein Tco025E_00026 [Trypanosoma conorhini]
MEGIRLTHCCGRCCLLLFFPRQKACVPLYRRFKQRFAFMGVHVMQCCAICVLISAVGFLLPLPRPSVCLNSFSPLVFVARRRLKGENGRSSCGEHHQRRLGGGPGEPGGPWAGVARAPPPTAVADAAAEGPATGEEQTHGAAKRPLRHPSA